MKISLLTLPLILLLGMPPAQSCGPFFKASLFSTYDQGKIILAAPVADVLAELLAAPGAPGLPVDEGVKFSGKAASLPEGLTVSEEGLSGDAWSVLQHDLSDLDGALGKASGRSGLLVSYAWMRRADLLKVKDEIVPGPAGAARPAGDWPRGLPAEFQLYGEGAAFFQQGMLPEAQACWEKVLALPAAERRCKGTWAAWMLGRTSFKSDAAACVKWFQRIREEAKSGEDSLGRAAASLGWEALAEEALLSAEPGGFSVARAEWLIFLLIRHAQAGGGEPFFLSGRHYATNQELAVRHVTGLALEWMKNAGRAKAAAASPFLRVVMTSCLLPIQRAAPQAQEGAGGSDSAAKRWFAALEAVHPGGSEDLADRLAWAAYEAGDYQESAAWLKRARESPMTHWLLAKQALQAGRMAEAAQHLEAAQPGFAIAQPQSDRHEDYEGYPEQASALQREQFQADLGLVRLAVDDFPGGLDALSRSGFWEDAAFVLENVVTAGEAVKYAEKWALEASFEAADAVLPSPLTVASLTAWLEQQAQGPVPAEGASLVPEPVEQNYAGVGMLHGALARRLAREDDPKGSREFQQAWLRPVLDLFLKQRAIGQNKDLPKAQRAAGFWKAALIHRYAGMELWGYEGFPDNAQRSGAFEAENLREFRLGILKPAEGTDPAQERPVIFPAVSAAEQARLKTHVPRPGKRFNYRYQAYALAKMAFDLMPDNSEDLAVMINLTGGWFVKHDGEAARRSVAELVKRCPATKLGKEGKARDWVVNVEAAVEDAVKRLD